MSEKNEIKKSERALKEEETLKYWQDNKIFEKTLKKPASNGEFVFYEGPPTANGHPGIHHLESRAFKDAIPRYKTMRGFHVRRRAGWDTHGLPVELEVEKELGFTGKKDIEEYGVEEFNKKCRESVMEYISEWDEFTTRIGYWLDQDDAYFTFDSSYMESLWHIVSQVNEQGFLYKDYKVLPWCPRCGTALSSHEVADGYKDVKHLAVTAKFELTDEPGTFVLAWTTTPWTLPGNVALAVGKDIDYVKVKKGEEKFIVAKDLLKEVFADEEYKEQENLKGKDLIGLSYKPLYPYLKELLPESEEDKLEKAYKIYSADFVTTEDGTGVVHTAVMYGQDDFVLGTKEDLPKHHLVTDAGKFVEDTDFLEGRFVHEEDLAVDIIKDLVHRGLLFSKEKHEHTYPHCWRCKTALIYYARDSWYIRMSELRDKLVKENSKINWEPAHIREGRFGEWLREIKDWAISRERYWGTPLPIWECDDCNELKVIGSIEELKNSTKKSGNKYFVMRHGEAEHNLRNIITRDPEGVYHLTDKAKKNIKFAVSSLSGEKIDLIIASPVLRTKETAELMAENLEIPEKEIVYDEHITEINPGEYESRPIDEYHKIFVSETDSLKIKPETGESFLDVKRRVGDFIYELDGNHSGKNILIVTHSGPAWMLFAATNSLDTKSSFDLHKGKKNFIEPGEVKKLDLTILPHNDNYELDLHKPYIDKVKLVCKCGGEMKRVPEVMDVWFDSGSMPFAQDHYPFENKEWVDGPGYPADYISEAIDQTRGWFYTLHAVGNLMGKGRAYKNVISLGHLLDAEGKKMSKSIGNIVDPWEEIPKHGVDIIRFWMYTINQPGESKSYDEKIVLEMSRKVIGTLSNVVRFYEMYAGEIPNSKSQIPKSEHILDKWILAKLNKLITDSTEWLDDYKLLEPGRAIREFIDEFSTWYIRRSRDRFKSDDKEDSGFAMETTRFVLIELSKLMAPFVPFFAEEIYRGLGGEKESVHLEDWPKTDERLKAKDEIEILENMQEVRRVVSLALEARASAGFKVRQPLASLKIRNPKSEIRNNEELLDLIKDEVNVKEIVFDESIGENNVELDTEITDELKQEGQARDLIREIQSMRKKAGLNPDEIISFEIGTDDVGKKLVKNFEEELKTTANIKEIKFSDSVEGELLELEDVTFKLRIK